MISCGFYHGRMIKWAVQQAGKAKKLIAKNENRREDYASIYVIIYISSMALKREYRLGTSSRRNY